MPIYEYRCLACRKAFSVLILRRAQTDTITCPTCHGRQIERLLSRFASPKTEAARLAALADPSQVAALDENNPQGVTRLMKDLGDEMGEDVGEDLEAAMEANSMDADPSPETP